MLTLAATCRLTKTKQNKKMLQQQHSQRSYSNFEWCFNFPENSGANDAISKGFSLWIYCVKENMRLIYSWSSQSIKMTTLDKYDFSLCWINQSKSKSNHVLHFGKNNKYAEINIRQMCELSFIQLKHIIAKANVDKVSI